MPHSLATRAGAVSAFLQPRAWIPSARWGPNALHARREWPGTRDRGLEEGSASTKAHAGARRTRNLTALDLELEEQ